MLERSLRYTDGTSDKFWMIQLEGSNHTVQFGRYGTTGQVQTKEFPTEAAALKSYEKLVAEKLKKGYIETGSEVSDAVKQKEPKPQTNQKTTRVTAVETTVETTVNSATVNSEVVDVADLVYPPERSLNLDPADWFWATWRDLPPLKRPEPKPFNLKDCLKRLKRAATSQYYSNYYRWDWEKAKIDDVLSREEAHFWFAAIMEPKLGIEIGQALSIEEFVEKLADRTFDGKVSTTHIKDSCCIAPLYHTSGTVLPLVYLLDPNDFIDLAYSSDKSLPIVQGFQTYLLPYFSKATIEELRSQVRSRLDLTKWRSLGTYSTPPPEFFLAACLGLHDELLSLIESWGDDDFRGKDNYRAHYEKPQEIIFGLNDESLIKKQMQRLGLTLFPSDRHSVETSAYIRAWLAHTEYSALELIRDSVLVADKKEEAEALLTAFAAVKASEAAPLMLELMLDSKAPKIARQWLQDYPAQAIAGLIPTAAGRGRLAEAAIDLLRSMKRKGYTAYIQTCLAHEPAEIAATVRKLVLEVEEKEYIPFDQHTTPDWLQQSSATLTETALTETAQKKAGWTVSVPDLPPITVQTHCLNAAQVGAVLQALRQSKLDSPHPLITAIRKECDRATLDSFAWKLFADWLAEGAPSKENWAMVAVGLLGADTSALKLTPLIRLWPGESQHHRAVLGLECLRAIGTDTALMQINGIAQKVKFKGIKQRAQDCMAAIAEDRQMTREQLEDRIVPDCDLDERGSRIFDFGARQFRLVFGADLKPMLKDAEHKLRSDLPKPNAKDDPEKAEQAIADWKLLKKQINEVIKLQPFRLEQAMVMERRWQVNEFELLLVQHPLMTHLIQRCIWGGYDASGQLKQTFRVTEDQTYADMQDEAFELAEVEQVGIVHPFHLSATVLSTWGELLSDYEIVQPFIQLGRSLHTLTTAERLEPDITCFKEFKVPIVTLVRTLENLGWQRGQLHDHGDYSLHFKYFPSANITAIVGEYEAVFVDLSVDIGIETDSIDQCCFLRGLHNHLSDYPAATRRWMTDLNEQRVPLDQVNPVILSEVLKDLTAVTSKAQ
jgi:predicted DNA-binding WGR domain protein